MAKKTYTEQLKNKAKKMLEAGKSFQEISKNTGVPRTTLGLWKKYFLSSTEKVQEIASSLKMSALEKTLLKMIDERIDAKLSEALKKLSPTPAKKSEHGQRD